MMSVNTAIRSMRGRVKHDERGTASFDWAIATGVLRQVSKDMLIDTLTAPQLRLVDDLALVSATGYDPYNRGR